MIQAGNSDKFTVEPRGCTKQHAQQSDRTNEQKKNEDRLNEDATASRRHGESLTHSLIQAINQLVGSPSAFTQNEQQHTLYVLLW